MVALIVVNRSCTPAIETDVLSVQVAAWVTKSLVSSGESSSEDDSDGVDAEQVRGQRKLWAIQVPKTS